MVRQEAVTWQDRAHFFGIAARIMRQILVQYARGRNTLKRDAGSKKSLTGDIAVDAGNWEVIIDLDEALNRMASWDNRKLEVIELHYFAGLKAEEISEALDLSLPTVRRDLLLGRAWLKSQFG
jgi:RNA polymerase sigma factor (TIGR02999 family)